MSGIRVHTGTTVAPRIRWTAPSMDGIAHAFPRAGVANAPCGAIRVDERFGYTVKVHCEACLVVMGAEQARTAGR